jgi:hypothetical protein
LASSGGWINLRSTDVVLGRGNVFVSIVTRCRHLVTALALARNSVLCTVVRILIGDGGGRLVVGVEGAVGCSSSVGASRLLATVQCASTEHGRVHTGLVNHPWEGGGGSGESCDECVLHDCCGSDVTRLC